MGPTLGYKKSKSVFSDMTANEILWAQYGSKLKSSMILAEIQGKSKLVLALNLATFHSETVPLIGFPISPENTSFDTSTPVKIRASTAVNMCVLQRQFI